MTTDGVNMRALPAKGVDEAITVLTQVRDDIHEELPKDARGIGRIVASDVQAAFPGSIAFLMPTPTGDGEKLVEYEVAAVADVSDSDSPVGSAGKSEDQVPLFRIVVTGMNAVYADMSVAAYQNVPQRSYGVEYLNRTQGSPSRFAWPVAHRAKGTANNVLQRHSRRKESDYTKALAKPDE